MPCLPPNTESKTKIKLDEKCWSDDSRHLKIVRERKRNTQTAMKQSRIAKELKSPLLVANSSVTKSFNWDANGLERPVEHNKTSGEQPARRFLGSIQKTMTTGACEMRLCEDSKTAPYSQSQQIKQELQKLLSCQQVLLGEFNGFKISAWEQLLQLKVDIQAMSEVILGKPSHRADDQSHVLGESKAESIVHNISPPKPREVPSYLKLWSSEYRLSPSGSQLEHKSPAVPHMFVQSLSSISSRPTSPPLSLSSFLGNKIKNCLDISSKTYSQKLTTEKLKDGSFDLSFYERSKAMRSTGKTKSGQQLYSQKVIDEVGRPIYCESMRTTTEREQAADSANTFGKSGMKTMVLPHLLQEVRDVTSGLKRADSNKMPISRSRPERKLVTHKANERLSRKGSLWSKPKTIAQKPDVARHKGRTATESQSHAGSHQKEIKVTSYDSNSRKKWPMREEISPSHRVTQSRIQSSSKYLKTEESIESEATGAMQFTLRGWAASFLQPPGSNSSGSEGSSLQEGASRQQPIGGKENNARFSGRTSRGGCAWTLTEHAGSQQHHPANLETVLDHSCFPP